MKRILFVLLAGALAGCDLASNPMAPSAVDVDGGVPQVAGTYSGELELRIPDAPGGGQRGHATLTVTVVQDGDQVSLTGTLKWPGDPATLVWDGVRGTIDRAGVLRGRPPENYDDPDCGRVRYGERELQFVGRALHYSATARSDRCGRFFIEALLPRLGG